METPVSAAPRLGIAAASAMIALLAALAVSGHWPGGQGLVRFQANGVVALPAAQVTDIAIEPGAVVLERSVGGWTSAGTPLTNAAAPHVEAALRLLNVSPPLRTLDADEVGAAGVAQFGLDPPDARVALRDASGTAMEVAFGAMNPTATGQYARVTGRTGLVILSRHVGAEWALVGDMARRAGQNLLLPVSLDRIWAVEIAAHGTLTRFERDGAGHWFHHVGQHVHIGAGDAHVADAALAGPIAAELAALGETAVTPVLDEALDPARVGLLHPSSILLLYARDNSDPVARIELGDLLPDGSRRYARLSDGTVIVSVAGERLEPLANLLRIAGALP